MFQDSFSYHLGVEKADGRDPDLVEETSPGEGTEEIIGSKPSESKKQGVQENEEDKWDTGDVVNENLISGGDIGTLQLFHVCWNN